jgi:hypothetical protein
LDATTVINTARINNFHSNAVRIGTLAVALLAGSAWAQGEEADSASKNNSVYDSVSARCTQQYSAEQCRDRDFLDENFHLSSLEAAHRIAMQRAQDERKALRELTLQRVCSISINDNCGNDANPAQCAAQLEEACATLKNQATACIQNAQINCVNDTDPNACYKRHIALCPSLKKQPIAQLLAKYPRLTSTQRSRLLTAAAELDAKTSGWWSNLITLLKTPLQ